jgi:hypothetical protein
MFINIESKLQVELKQAQENLLLNVENLKLVRNLELSQLTHKFSSGSIVQVRPSDLVNFQFAIAEGNPEHWVMDDLSPTSVELLSCEDMEIALKSGILQGKAIWRNHTTALQALNK